MISLNRMFNQLAYLPNVPENIERYFWIAGFKYIFL